MAKYGTVGVFNTGPAFTGWTFTLSRVPGTQSGDQLAGSTGSAEFNGLTQEDNRIANSLNKKANQAIRMLLISMVGAAPGGLASKSFKTVRAQTAQDNTAGSPTTPPGLNIGGLVPIDTIFYINRANTVTDDSNLTALLNRTHGPAAYPVDISGVGGGGKASVSIRDYF